MHHGPSSFSRFAFWRVEILTVHQLSWAYLLKPVSMVDNMGSCHLSGLFRMAAHTAEPILPSPKPLNLTLLLSCELRPFPFGIWQLLDWHGLKGRPHKSGESYCNKSLSSSVSSPCYNPFDFIVIPYWLWSGWGKFPRPFLFGLCLDDKFPSCTITDKQSTFTECDCRNCYGAVIFDDQTVRRS